LLWSFTVLGEPSSQLDDDAKADHPGLPRPHCGRIVDRYWQISTGILLATAQDDTPAFLARRCRLGIPAGTGEDIASDDGTRAVTLQVEPGAGDDVGRTTIQAVRFTDLPRPDYVSCQPEELPYD
jgi:hypothetical protein